MDLEKNIGAELHSLLNLMRRTGENTCRCDYRRKTDLTEMQTRVICFLFLNRDRDIFQKDIEKEFSIRRATVSILLQSMEVKELIARESVPYDARLKKVVLTEKARELAEAAYDEICGFEQMLKEDIPSEDLKVFFRVSGMIRKNIEKNFKPKLKKGENTDV